MLLVHACRVFQNPTKGRLTKGLIGLVVLLSGASMRQGQGVGVFVTYQTKKSQVRCFASSAREEINSS